MKKEEKPVKSKIAEREEEILKFWKENKIFEKSLKNPSADGPKGEFVFYEGPPTANGKPGIHHLEARAFKDAIPRYKTMRGFHVRRKGGWDTHGLPVELQVEKQLGLKSKKEIEKYGIAEFNKKCKESVWQYKDIWEKFTERIGYWIDLKNPYITYENSYIESVWHILKEVNKKNLLYKDYKVVPWCPRCGTALSSHELAQGYENVKDLSVYVKFEVQDGQALGTTYVSKNTYILAWTTTPWTLPGNVALAVGNDIEYIIIHKDGSHYILAKDLASKIFQDFDESDLSSWEQIVPFDNKNPLIGLKYEPLYFFIPKETPEFDKAYRVYAADFVNTEEGTGIVHTAVMYGQDDFELGTKVGLPKFHLVNEDGTFKEEVGFLTGKFVKSEDTDVEIIKDLAHRSLLFKKEKYEHSYPHCWRCKTPLIYYARDSWYVRMSQLRDKLIKENEKINWVPTHIKEGRFGEWLREVKDWAISRERYWGTPLPIWQDKEGNFEVIGSIEELKEKSGGKLPVNEKGEIDLHRPYIDEIELVNKKGEKLERVKEVLDVWFDSGAMPFAQDHYPFSTKEILYPTDYISEAIDQTRGWFYTLHAVGILMDKGRAYKNVICLGHILDAEGKKMSKSLGNIVDPWIMLDKFGADTLRFWMYSVNQPGESKNFDEKTVDEIVKKVFNPLYNVYSFYELYRDKSLETPKFDINFNPKTAKGVLDSWIFLRVIELTEKITKYLDEYKLTEPVRDIRDFINDLSTWYLRRSREEIKAGNQNTKKQLFFILRRILILLAPFAPFVAEDLYQKLHHKDEPISVHLLLWPSIDSKYENADEILKNMELVRNVVSEILMARNAANIKIRQPLSKVEIQDTRLEGKKEFIELIKDETNIKEIIFNKQLNQSFSLDTNITPKLKKEGSVRELIRAVQELRKEKGLRPFDSAELLMETDSAGKKFVNSVMEQIKKPTNLSEIVFTENEGKEIEIDGMKFKIELK
ncbi:MAG: isoleucine--tRNA ligase [Patescibacteria group bacterium]